MLGACAVVAPCSPQTHAQAAASLAEAVARGEEQEGEGKKEKRTRKKKDPAAPKKALTAYLVFINSKREQIIREHPSADLKDQVSPSHVLLLPTHAPQHTFATCQDGRTLRTDRRLWPQAEQLHAFCEVFGNAIF